MSIINSTPPSIQKRLWPRARDQEKPISHASFFPSFYLGEGKKRLPIDLSWAISVSVIEADRSRKVFFLLLKFLRRTFHWESQSWCKSAFNNAFFYFPPCRLRAAPQSIFFFNFGIIISRYFLILIFSRLNIFEIYRCHDFCLSVGGRGANYCYFYGAWFHHFPRT